jgi:hypothetical protein
MQYRDMRWPCDHPVVLVLGDRKLQGRILNVSSAGARVRLAEAPERGTQVRLDLQGPPLVAQVRWVRGGQAGLRFDRGLTPREIGLVRKAERTQMRAAPGWNLQLRELG